MTSRPWPRRLLSFLLIAAAFGFLAREILRNLDGLREFDWRLQPWTLLFSGLALVLVLLAGVGYWAVVLRGFGIRAPLIPLARTWFLANLSRYIPGMVWQFVSLAQFGGGAGLTPVVSITSLLVQMGFMLLSATALGVLLLPGSPLGELYPVLRQLQWLAPLVLVAVHPAVIRTLVGLLGRLSRRATVAWNGTWLQGVALLLLATGLWWAFGAAFFLFLRAFVALPWSLLPTVTAIHALAFLIGYLAFFAPAGLGFKDAALTLLLAGLVPSPVAASLAVLARLWSIAGELLPALALLPAARLRRDGRSGPGGAPASPTAPPAGGRP